MKRLMMVSAVALALTACAGGQAGIGANTGGGFPGIGLGAGLSLPIGGSAKSDEAYVNKIIARVERNVENVDAYEGKLCTIRITADSDGQLMDVKRMEGDEEWCDALMVAAYKMTRLPVPPEEMVNRLKKGLVIDFIPK